MVFLYITCKDAEEAKKIGRELVAQKAAGWVNISPAEAIFREDGAVKESMGASLLVKTIESKVQDVEDITRRMHSHRVPCVASFSLYRLNREYKDWLIGAIA